MKTTKSLRSVATGLVLSVIATAPGTASAVTMSTRLQTIYQIGNGAQVNIGHTVIAHTNLNRLLAGGTYVAACAASEMLPTSGQRSLSSQENIGGNQLYVTIPSVLPARVNMPGFNAAALRGRRLDCTYTWTSRAVEGSYTIGAGGGGFAIGGEEMTEGSTESFSMNVPGLGDGNGDSSCIP